MDKSEIMYKVKNRSASRVVYKDAELKLRREFQPGETKLISYEELEKLTYIPGGRALMANFLQLEPQAVEKVGIPTEPEYYMSEQQVKDLLLTGSIDQFLDCLDFAPEGVIDLIKEMSIRLPLQDIQKRRALKEKVGFDVDAALQHMEEEQVEARANRQQPVRRVKDESLQSASISRRTAVNYYEEAKAEEETAEEVVIPKKTTGKRGRKPASATVETAVTEDTTDI